MTPGRAATATFLAVWIGCSLGGMVLGFRPGLPGVVGIVAGAIAAAVIYRLAGGRPVGPGD